MHEMAVTQALIEQVRSFVPAHGVVRLVRLEVGELEHLDEVVMATAWSGLTEGTALAGATLDMTRVPVRMRCRACRHEYEPSEGGVFLCPACDAVRPEVLEGSGVLLRSIEIEDDVDDAATAPGVDCQSEGS